MLALLPVLAMLQAAPSAPSITVYPAAAEVAVGESVVLEVRSAGPQSTVIRTATFVSSAPRVASVDSGGQVTALAPGEARVTALVDGEVAFATIRVPALPAAEITARLPVPGIRVGAWAPLDISVRDRRGEALPAASLRFASETPELAAVDGGGRIVGIAPGNARIRVTSGNAETRVTVPVDENPAVSYRLVPESAAVRTGDVVRLRVDARDASRASVDGFLPEWTLSAPGAWIEAEGAEGVFVAEEPGRHRITAVVGPAHTETAFIDVEPRGLEGELVRVGRGPAAPGGGHHSGDSWVFEGVDGRDYAIIGTYAYDWFKVWDVTDPGAPVLTDSIQLDARRINDVKVHPNNRLAVITREGASNRRNGIVILDLSTPSRPTILSTYDETVTGGVHNVWITENPDLVYACHNGTSDIHIIDISDPARPREVGRWGVESESKTLHDIIVQDGYAYASYWDDGVVILDVGAGTHGGTPTEPVYVSSFKYPTGNTHTAWRHGDYLFVGDEIFPPDWDPYTPIEARGYVHVLDVSDIDNPREVARYEVPEAGVHNFWPEGDHLYVGYYQAGLRVLDISGELRGDLYRQGREIAVLKTTDEDSMVPNWPMTWGAQPFKGNLFTSDLNSGLWIARFIREGQVVF